MKRALTIALAAAAFVTASAMALADTYSTLSNPRIIHVPQPGDELRRTQASLHGSDVDDDEETAVPQRPRRVERPAPPRAKPPTKKTDSRERRRPFSVSLPEPPPPPEPEPTGPKRALLSAPPPPPTPSIHDGPTPLKPTPRFGQPLPEAPPPLTSFTPPPMPAPAARPVAAAPAVELGEPALALPQAVDDNDDHLPPPGDPKLAPPEPRD